MKSILTKTYVAGMLALASLSIGYAQTRPVPTIFIPHYQQSNYHDRVIKLPVVANVDYTVMTDAPWIKVQKTKKGVNLKVDMNGTPFERTATITFADVNNHVKRTLTFTQDRDGSAQYVETGEVAVANASTNNANSEGESIQKTIDGNTGTIYHSNWNSPKVTPTSPAILTYNFTNVPQIDYINYIPRKGESNGNFGRVEVYYKLEGQTEYTKYKEYDFKFSSDPSTILFEGGLKKPISIQFKVLTGYGDFASCAEMQFRKTMDYSADFHIFADDLLSELKPGTKQEDVDKITNPFFKNLAQKLLNGTYEKNYRVGTYECFLSPVSLSHQWSTPGKLYDQIQGVTGINITKGKQVIIVKGLPEKKTVPMRVVQWYSQDLKADNEGALKGGGPVTIDYVLHNGVNVIDYNGNKDGLAYICYYDEVNPDAQPKISVHFVNAQINGYLSPDKTNDEMDAILAKAPNRCIDLFGSKVHSIWEVDGMRNYCKATDGVSKGYRQYMNVLDSLVHWEHRLLGFEKYGLVPKNKTMAYVNYTYYMFQGGFGVSFIYSQQSRVLNARTIVYNDDDAIWGLSHEWGHQHQMQPYFCWAGLSESSNNMNSCDNILRMGYPGSRILSGWHTARENFLEDKGHASISEHRRRAYMNKNRFSWNPKILAMAEAMKDSTIYSIAENPDKAISTNEVYVESNLAPFFMLHAYFSQHGKPDYSPDMYQSLRETDKTDDKYAILAAAQNGVNGKYDEFAKKYPNSVWVKEKYVSNNSSTWQNSVPYIYNYVRKCSILTGYNLFPYFEKWGFFRTIAMTIDDYGYKDYCMTPDMKEEFKKDMYSMGLPEISSEMINTISTIAIPQYPRPTFPN